MMKLKNILLEQGDDNSVEKTDSLSNPEKKLNVLFIGDEDLDSASCYARQILNTRLVTGDVVSTEGDIIKVFRLLQSNINKQYDVVSLMFSNIVSTQDINSIDVLKAMYSIIKDNGSILITISPTTKQYAPYNNIKWQNNDSISNWMNSTNISDFNIDSMQLLNDKIYFQKNKLLLNKEGHLRIAKVWLNYIRNVDVKVDSNILDKQKKLKQLKGELGDELKVFKKGDMSPDLKPIQQRLIELGYIIEQSEYENGKFDQSTYNAVKKFQTSNDIPVTGYIDINVHRKLYASDVVKLSAMDMFFGADSWLKKLLGGDTSPLLDEPEVDPLAPEGGTVIDSETSQAVTTKFGFPEADFNFYKKILNDLNVPITTQNLLFFAAWRVGEFGTSGKGTTGVGCTNNPFATTYNLKKDSGMTVFNSAGVKNYTKPEYGIEAIVKTLRLGYYTEIVQGLKDDVGALELSYRLEKSPWGTQHTSDILKSYKTIYASKIAGNPGSTALKTFDVEPSTTDTTTTTSLDVSSLPTGKNGQLASSELGYIIKSDGKPHPSARLANIAVKYYNAMVAAAKKEGINLDVSGDDSAYRRLGSSAEGCGKGFSQWCAWQKYQAGTGNLAASPGTSNHGLGLAIDIDLSGQGRSSQKYKWLAKNANKYGWYETVSSEPWHWDFKYNKVKVNLNTSSTTAANVGGVGKSIVIGDSLVPYVAKGAGIEQGPKELWKGGIAVGTLLSYANSYKTADRSVKNVVISIGTNGIFSRSTNTITQLVARLHVLFPNAKLLVVRGTYGSKISWSKPLMNVSQKTVDAYYSDFSANGAKVLPTAVGNVPDAHGHLPVYQTIGREIKANMISTAAVQTTKAAASSVWDTVTSWFK